MSMMAVDCGLSAAQIARRGEQVQQVAGASTLAA
jgi:hypothetical protein